MEIFVHSSREEHPEIVDIEVTAIVRSLLVETEVDGRVWLEEVEEEIDLELTIEQAGIGRHHHVHRGRCQHVEVNVRFNGVYERAFAPATTIRTIHRWACGADAANLSAEQAATHVLAVPGSDHSLESGVHVGSLLEGQGCTVNLDLMPRKRFEG